MKVLMTGATGFIGQSILADEARDFEVRTVLRRTLEHWDFESFFIENLDGHTDWNGAFGDVEVIIHLAGLAHLSSFSEEDYHSVNVQGTLNLAKCAAAAGVRKFVFVSTIGVNGTNSYNRAFLPNDVAKPHNPYSRSKYEAELGLWDISKQTGLEVVVVRPTLVYGPNAPGNFGSLTKLITKLPILPFGMADNQRSFIAVQNLADLLVTCALSPNATGHTFLASDGEAVSTKVFSNAIVDGLGRKVTQLPIPVKLLLIAGKLTGKAAMIEQLFGNLQVDSSNLKEVLGWEPPLSMKQAMLSLRHSSK